MDLTPQPVRITASIGTLVLRGLPPTNTARVEQAFIGELSRLLRDAAGSQPAWAAGSADEAPKLRFKLHTQPTERTLGRALARAVFKQIRGPQEVHS